MPGILFVVATPIGNLQDITFRAIEILKTVDMIACEDTRHTGKLLSRYNINKPLTSYFEHNKLRKTEYLLKLLAQGRSIALVSDSGTPGISDPGYKIINLCIQNNINVKVVPGPCALVTALVASGLPTDSFVFLGFLSSKGAKRKKQLTRLTDEDRTIIIYESPHRALKTVQDIHAVLGDRKIALGRELTKMFEETIRVRTSEAIKCFIERPPKGEFVIVIEGKR